MTQNIFKKEMIWNKEYKSCIQFYEENKNEKYTIEDYHFIAFSFFKDGNLFESKKYFDICLNHNIDFKHVLYNNYALLLYNQGKFEESEIYFLKSIKESSNFILPIINLGNFYFLNEDYLKSEKYFLNSIQLNSMNIESWIRLGEIYLKWKDYHEALKCCKKGKEIDSKNINLLILVSIIKNEMNLPNESLKILENLNSLYPNNSIILNSIGDFYLSNNIISKSLNSYFDSIKLNSNNLRNYDSILYLMLKSNQYFNSISLLKNLNLKYTKYLPFKEKENLIRNIFDETLNQSSMNPLNYQLEKLISIKHLNKNFLMKDNLNLNYFDSNFLKHLSFILLNQSESNITSFILIKHLYEKNEKNNFFFYYLGLSEIGLPNKLIQYSEYLYKTMKNEKVIEPFCFYLKLYSLIRQNDKKVLELNLNNLLKLFEILTNEFKDENLNLILNEKLLLFYRLKRLSNFELEIKDSMNTMKQKILYIKYLYLKNNLISSKQGLNLLNNLINKSNESNQLLEYLRLKYLVQNGNLNLFESLILNFKPITFEYHLKKYKLLIKFYFSNFNLKKIEELLIEFEIEINTFKKWKIKNGVSTYETHDNIKYSNLKLDSMLYYYKLKLKLLKNSIDYVDESKMILNEEKYLDVLIKNEYFKNESITSILKYYNKYIQNEDNSKFDYYSICFREISFILSISKMNQQSLSLLKYSSGTFRFQRIDSIYYLMEISFLNQDFVSLESYYSKIDINLLNNLEYIKDENDIIITHLHLFKFSIQLNKLKVELKQNKEKKKKYLKNLMEELIKLFDILIQNFTFLKTYFFERIEETLLKYLTLIDDYFYIQNDSINIVKNILNHFPNSIQSFIFLIKKEKNYFKRRDYYLKLIKLLKNERKNEYILLFYKDTLENDENIKIDLFKELNINFDLKDLNKFKEIMMKRLKEFKTLNLIEIEIIDLKLNNNTLLNDYFKNEIKMIKNLNNESIYFSKTKQQLNNYLEMNNIYLNHLINESNFNTYLNNVEMIWKNENDFLKRIILRIHLFKLNELMNTPLNINQSQIKFLNINSIDQYLDWIFLNSTLNIKNDNKYQEINKIKKEEENIIFKYLRFLFSMNEKDDLILILSKLLNCFLVKQDDNYILMNQDELIKQNLDFLFFELSIESIEFKIRLFKLNKNLSSILHLFKNFFFQFLKNIKKNRDFKNIFIKYFYQKIKKESEKNDEFQTFIEMIKEKEIKKSINNINIISNIRYKLKNELLYSDWRLFFISSLIYQQYYILKEKDLKYLNNSFIFIYLFLRNFIKHFNRDFHNKIENIYNDFEEEEENSESNILYMFDYFFSNSIPSTKYPFLFEELNDDSNNVIFHSIKSIIPLFMNNFEQILCFSKNIKKILEFIYILIFLIENDLISIENEILNDVDYLIVFVKSIYFLIKNDINIINNYYHIFKNDILFSNFNFLMEISKEFNNETTLKLYLDHFDNVIHSLIYFNNIFNKEMNVSKSQFSFHFLNIFNLQFKSKRFNDMKLIKLSNGEIQLFLLNQLEEIRYDLISKDDFYSSHFCGHKLMNHLTNENYSSKKLNFLKLNNMFFLKMERNIQKMNEIFSHSKINTSSNQRDISVWFKNQEIENEKNIILNWNTISKIKLKKSDKIINHVENNYLFNNIFYSKIDQLIKEIAIVSSYSWFYGIQYFNTEHIGIDFNKNEGIFNLNQIDFIFESFLEEINLQKGTYFNFFSSEDLKTILSISNNGNDIFKDIFIKSLKNLLNQKNILYSNFLIQSFLEKDIIISKLKIQKEKDTNINKITINILKKEEDIKYISNINEFVNDKKEVDYYILKMLKRKIKLQKRMNKVKNELIEPLPNQIKEENTTTINVIKKEKIKLSEFKFNVLERMFKRENGNILNELNIDQFDEMKSFEEMFEYLNKWL
eukprot:gene5076-8676_t